MIQARPNSLSEVARRTRRGSSFEYELADFLHEFAPRRNAAMLSETPVPLCALHDAYLAAVAAYLSAQLGVATPRWTRQPERILAQPWFAKPGQHMRALLLVESPAAFRERNLFVTANALSVA